MSETAVVTLLFADLVGSTELLTSLGDDANDQVRRRVLSALNTAATDHGGEVVKSAGDGVMVAFRRSAADAVTCAVSMQRATTAIEHDGTPLGLQLRIGVSSGEASYEDGDWFGTPVVEAARLESTARPGQILVSDVVRSIVGTRGGQVFRSAGKRDLKGFARPLAVAEVVWRDASTPPPSKRKSASRSRKTRALVPAALGLSVVAIAAGVAVILLTRSGDDGGAAASTLTTEGYAPKLESIDCADGVSDDVICERLVVPENRQKPEGRQVHFAVTTYPSRVGGDSVPTVTVGWFGDNFEESAVRQYGDSVVVDFRAYGSDPPLSCPETAAVERENLALVTGDPKAKQLSVTADLQCGQRLVSAGVDLNQYGLVDVANDVRDLAIAKGWRQINVQSTGDYSQIAIVLARLYPSLVRSMVIVDPVPLDAPINTQIPNLVAAIDRYVAACNADAGCKQAFPNLKDTITAQYQELQQNPRLISTKDPLRDGNIQIQLDGDRLIYSMLVGLNTQGALGIAASTLSAPEESLLAATAAFFAENAPLHPDLPWGFWNSMNCEDTQPLVSRSGLAAAEATYPMFHAWAATALNGFDSCAVWPTKADSALRAERKIIPVPALILAGELSPFFPGSYAEKAGENFGNPTVAVFPNLTGLPLRDGPECVRELRLGFLRDPKATLDVEGCKAQVPKIKFEGTS